MTNSELHELLKRELALPSEIQKKKHPTIKSSKAEFVDYAKDGKFTLAYPLRPDQRNGYHLLQGGYISVFSMIISDFLHMWPLKAIPFPQSVLR